jgi:hypothetical protein
MAESAFKFDPTANGLQFPTKVGTKMYTDLKAGLDNQTVVSDMLGGRWKVLAVNEQGVFTLERAPR